MGVETSPPGLGCTSSVPVTKLQPHLFSLRWILIIPTTTALSVTLLEAERISTRSSNVLHLMVLTPHSTAVSARIVHVYICAKAMWSALVSRCWISCLCKVAGLISMPLCYDDRVVRWGEIYMCECLSECARTDIREWKWTLIKDIRPTRL